MTSGRSPRRVPEFHLEQMDGELLLYHPALARTVRLNESASLVWLLCDGRRSAKEIADVLRAAFPDAPAIDEDVAHVLTRLAEEGALELT